MFTQEQVNRYVNGGGGTCPFCGSQQFDGEESVIEDDGYASQAVTCVKCDKQWTDVYQLVGVVENEVDATTIYAEKE